MFLPQGAEEDQYDKNGNQIDDINSMVEFISVSLGYDHTADDEDDDSGQNFHIVKAFDYNFEQPFSLLQNDAVSKKSNNEFPDYVMARIKPVCFDVITPPPEA
jgi:hypothetical protein